MALNRCEESGEMPVGGSEVLTWDNGLNVGLVTNTTRHTLTCSSCREVSSSRCCIYCGFCNVRFTWLQAGPVYVTCTIPVSPVSTPACPAELSWRGRTLWWSNNPSWGIPTPETRFTLQFSCVIVSGLTRGQQYETLWCYFIRTVHTTQLFCKNRLWLGLVSDVFQIPSMLLTAKESNCTGSCNWSVGGHQA